jgi:UDP-2,3-diacylglucosamine pyrophosphatase LpxH
VQTAVVSDLHLGLLLGEDLVRAPEIRETLLDGLTGADRIVLLGDVIEMRDQPLAAALEASRPFFEALGDRYPGAEVVLVPGNHDHHLAEPLLERRALAKRPALGLEHRFRPAAASARISSWLGKAGLSLSYPGIWLRDDVYATHGHYMDCHLALPRLECLAAAAVMRFAGPPPAKATPDDYERILRPVYGFSFGLAQSGTPQPAGGGSRPSERAWRAIQATGESGLGRRAARSLTTAGVRATVWSLNRALRTQFDPDVSARGISRGGIEAATELANRLRTGAAHVITGHTHRRGPSRPDGWPIPVGGELHNTGSWIFSGALCAPGAERSAFWPGTLTWLEDEGPPGRIELLDDRSVDELAALVKGLRRR